MQSEQQMKGLQMSSSSFSLSVGWRNALTEKNKETYNNQIITFCRCSEITGLCIRALVARRDRIVVSTLRCGRSNLGSNPSHGIASARRYHGIRACVFFFAVDPALATCSRQPFSCYSLSQRALLSHPLRLSEVAVRGMKEKRGKKKKGKRAGKEKKKGKERKNKRRKKEETKKKEGK